MLVHTKVEDLGIDVYKKLAVLRLGKRRWGSE